MAGKERKLVAIASGANAVGVSTRAIIAATESMENFHNIWISIAVEPENAGANANGQWALWAIRTASAKRAGPNATRANIADDENQDILVAAGAWVAANFRSFPAIFHFTP